ncbi:MAG: LapA family protein [Gemmatimonadota bacterium]
MSHNQLRAALLVIVVALFLVLILQNTETVLTTVFFWTVEMPRFVLLGSMFAVGGIIGFLAGRRQKGQDRNPGNNPPSGASR